MPVRGSKKAKRPRKISELGNPRTVRLSPDDEAWVDSQLHVDGFSGVMRDALHFYRERRDQERAVLLEAAR